MLQGVVELEPENADARQKLAEILRQLKANRTAEKDQASNGPYLENKGVYMSHIGFT